MAHVPAPRHLPIFSFWSFVISLPICLEGIVPSTFTLQRYGKSEGTDWTHRNLVSSGCCFSYGKSRCLRPLLTEPLPRSWELHAA